jgi:hypothetical protein
MYQCTLYYITLVVQHEVITIIDVIIETRLFYIGGNQVHHACRTIISIKTNNNKDAER